MKKVIVFIKRLSEKLASSINHRNVLKDVYLEVEISGSYFVTLTLANLIALNGLIQNSVAVIIGAMLISPLMGPILSFGFAFITGDNSIWSKSAKKISISVAATIIIAAIATYISPLKDITHEIVSRTRPNLYDLIIAFLAGTAGAIAICTKKNYLTIVPGVAIATAVIPPLSVAGFGIGTGNFTVSFGGFLLFFTNFTAIIIATCIVFYLYGFKPSIISETDVSALKKRISSLAVVLIVISIPLIYTLQQSIAEVGLRTNIKKILESEFNKTGVSSLSSFSYSKGEDKGIDVHATVNTVSYLKEAEIDAVEKKLRNTVRQTAKLNVEQIKVHPGGLKEPAVKTSTPAIAPPKAPQEIIKGSKENIVAVVRQLSEKIEKIISPAIISDFFVGFHDKTSTVSIALKIKKDIRLTEKEINILKKIFSSELNLPVDLKVETVPLIPLLIFKKGDASVSDNMKTVIGAAQEIYLKDKNVTILIEAFPESGVGISKGRMLSEKRINAVTEILHTEYKIPMDNIKTALRKPRRIPTVKISAVSGKEQI